METTSDTKYLTTAQAADVLSLSPKTLRNWATSAKPGSPPVHRFGAAVRYNTDDLQNWVTAQRKEHA